MNSKNNILITGILVVVILMTGACSAGFLLGRAVGSYPTPLSILPAAGEARANGSETEAAGEPVSRDELFAPFWQAWDIVHERYVDQPVDDKALMRGAISGMLQALGDKHTSYMDPASFENSTTVLQGEYEGIGATVDTTAEYLTIVATTPGSPAEKAGLKPGDQVIAIDGEDMTGLEGEMVRRKVIGPAGTQVKLTIRREGVDKPLEIVVTRAKIILPAIESKMLEDNIAYVRINYPFGEKTSSELKRSLRELMARDPAPAGMIVDLRNNGGGYLQSAIDVASQFIDEGVILYEKYGDGSRQTFKAEGGGLATDIPLVVLVNEGTASASEIVAGAIQDHGRGQLVGVTTYGKGSVQTVTPLQENEGAVRVTVARWLTPDGRTIHELGLTPDVEVQMTDEDVKAQRDPQLDAAIKLLTGARP